VEIYIVYFWLHLSKRVADEARTHIRNSWKIVEYHFTSSIRAESDLLLEDALADLVLDQELLCMQSLQG
jgi:hypothetical protein